MRLSQVLAALFTGHSNAQMVAKYQPAKLAAMEGHFNTGRGDLTIIGIPDPEARTTKLHLSLPGCSRCWPITIRTRPLSDSTRSREHIGPPFSSPSSAFT